MTHPPKIPFPRHCSVPLVWFEKVSEYIGEGGKRLLVFGLGNDSLYYNTLNKNGTTFFIEDQQDWIDRYQNYNLNILQYTYTTKVSDYKKYLSTLPPLIELPLWGWTWDLILIDGPMGYRLHLPGRASPIYTAAMLDSSVILLDDYERPLEHDISNHYLGKPDNTYGPNNRIAEWINF